MIWNIEYFRTGSRKCSHKSFIVVALVGIEQHGLMVQGKDILDHLVRQCNERDSRSEISAD